MDCSSLKKLIECKDGNITVMYKSPRCLRDRFYLVYMIVFGDGSYYIGKSNVGYQRMQFHCKTKLEKVKDNYLPKLASAFKKNDDFSIYSLSEINSKDEPDENDFLAVFQPPLNTNLCQQSKPYGNGRIKAVQIFNKINNKQ